MKFMSGSVLLVLLPLAFCFAIVGADARNTNRHPKARVHAAGASPLITRACQKATHKELCLSVLNADPQARTVDLKGLAVIALKAASKNATAMASLIKKSSGNDELEEQDQDSLDDCTQNYLSAVEEIDDSIDALTKGNQANVGTLLQSAIADIDSCDDSAQDPDGGFLQLVSHGNHVLRQLCENAISLAQAMPGSHH